LLLSWFLEAITVQGQATKNTQKPLVMMRIGVMNRDFGALREENSQNGHTHLSARFGILRLSFRALVFGLALCFGESINLT
jgi:hypothetical protein